ncbi:7958_t:CDS:2, partial [Racocetra fulgida]
MKKAKKSLSTHPTTTRPSTPITRSTTIRPTTSNTQLSTAESATSITQPNTNIPITSTTQLSTTESATTRSSTNNDRPTQLSIAESATSTTQSNTNIPATSTTQSSTNRDRPITSNTQLYIAESATSTTQSGTNQPAIFTTQPTTTSQITPSRHTNVLLSFSSSSSSSSSPIIQEEYERDTMRRNRKFEELENVINELHGVTLRQDRNIMGITDQINYLMSSVSTLIDDIDELYDLSQSDDQDSFEWVMEESSTNALRRYFSIKNGKRTNKYDLDELRKLLNKSDHESSDAEERDENKDLLDWEMTESDDECDEE